VDDDGAMRLAVERLLVAGGYPVSKFPSAEALLDSDMLGTAGCLILDIQLPGLSGLQLRHRLAAEGRNPPTIFITAHDDARTRERVLASRPVAFLIKPFEGRRLLDAVARALKE
jgi:FixJ family two-component response regulator